MLGATFPMIFAYPSAVKVNAATVAPITGTTGKHTGSQITYRPTAYTVCTTGEITLFKRHNRCIALRDGYAGSHMECNGIAVVYNDILGKIEIPFDILCEWDTQQ